MRAAPATSDRNRQEIVWLHSHWVVRSLSRMPWLWRCREWISLLRLLIPAHIWQNDEISNSVWPSLPLYGPILKHHYVFVCEIWVAFDGHGLAGPNVALSPLEWHLVVFPRAQLLNAADYLQTFSIISFISDFKSQIKSFGCFRSRTAISVVRENLFVVLTGLCYASSPICWLCHLINSFILGLIHQLKCFI